MKTESIVFQPYEPGHSARFFVTVLFGPHEFDRALGIGRSLRLARREAKANARRTMAAASRQSL